MKNNINYFLLSSPVKKPSLKSPFKQQRSAPSTPSSSAKKSMSSRKPSSSRKKFDQEGRENGDAADGVKKSLDFGEEETAANPHRTHVPLTHSRRKDPGLVTDTFFLSIYSSQITMS